GDGCRSAPTAKSCVFVSNDFGPTGSTPVKTETVADGLEVPWALAFLPGGDLLVTERPGRIRLVTGGALVAAPVATVQTDANGEGGLQGLALDPDFAS